MPSPLRLLAVSTCLAAPAALWAECPVPADLATGIAVRDDSGGLTTYRSGDLPGEVTETTVFEDGTGFFIRSQGGLLVLENSDLEGGAQVADTTILTTLENPGAAFPVAEGRTHEVQGVETGPGTEGEKPVSVLIETSLRRQVVYGGCTVSAIPIRLTYHYADADEVEHLDYLPEFGIALYLGGGEAGQAPDIYRIVDFTKAAPAQ